MKKRLASVIACSVLLGWSSQAMAQLSGIGDGLLLDATSQAIAAAQPDVIRRGPYQIRWQRPLTTPCRPFMASTDGDAEIAFINTSRTPGTCSVSCVVNTATNGTCTLSWSSSTAQYVDTFSYETVLSNAGCGDLLSQSSTVENYLAVRADDCTIGSIQQ
jgi:hypothetical protein